MAQSLETATLAGGCFWCLEAIFKRLKGVTSVTAGYSGGRQPNPSYEVVSTGLSGHAEAIQIRFDPKIIPFEQLLDVFFHLLDPTTLNQQGPDIGTQYCSVIFYHDDGQKQTAQKVVEEIQKSKMYPNPVVTEIVPYTSFYAAEDYHQNFYDNNRNYGYCQIIIDPKIQKLSKDFKEITKSSPTSFYVH